MPQLVYIARRRRNSCGPGVMIGCGSVWLTIIVVTTLSPSRNSVSIEYMTALMASVVFRYSAMLARPGALMNCAISSNERSKSAVVASEALDCPRWTFSYRGASETYNASSLRGGWVLAALFVTIRPSRAEREVPADGVDVYRVRIHGDRLQPRPGFADVAGPLAPGGDHDHQHIAE